MSDEPVKEPDPEIIRCILSVPKHAYPSGLKIFASCHESYSEAQNVDQTFLGKTWKTSLSSRLGIARTPYFWKPEPWPASGKRSFWSCSCTRTRL